MKIKSDSLPNDVEALKKLVLQQQQRIGSLEETLRLERHRRFGSSSEKAPGQGELFNEAEVTAEVSEPNKEEPVAEPRTRKKPVRKPLPEDLPRIREVTELSKADKQCACGCELTEIGEEVSEQLDIIPAQIQVIQHVRKSMPASTVKIR